MQENAKFNDNFMIIMKKQVHKQNLVDLYAFKYYSDYDVWYTVEI